jgi:hypothetical protein
MGKHRLTVTVHAAADPAHAQVRSGPAYEPAVVTSP